MVIAELKGKLGEPHDNIHKQAASNEEAHQDKNEPFEAMHVSVCRLNQLKQQTKAKGEQEQADKAAAKANSRIAWFG